VGYGYDPRGNVASVTYPDGSAVSYGYDGDNRLSLVTDAEGNETKYSYDPAGRLSGLTQTGGSGFYSYNAKGLPAKAEYRAGDILLLEESLAYDVLGRITGSRCVGNVPAVTGSESYAYDAAGEGTATSTTGGGT
jgi:YD repeat-containing protein